MPGDVEGWDGGVKFNYGILEEFPKDEIVEDGEGRGIA